MHHNMFQMKKEITFMPLYILKIIDYALKKKKLFTPLTSIKGTITYLFRKNIYMLRETSMNLE